MTLPRPRYLALAWLMTIGVAHAQTQPSVPSPTPPTAVPNEITPPGGIARGVIKPNRPVDPNMVKHPPTNAQHKMPVIRPPGTAR